MSQIPSQDHLLLLVDGGWGSWTGVSQCSASCEGGKKVRTRRCNNPLPRNGGRECQGRNSDSLDCNSVACTGTKKNWSEIQFFEVENINFGFDGSWSDIYFFHLQMPYQDLHFTKKRRLVAIVRLIRTFGLVMGNLKKNVLRCVAIDWSVHHSFTS